ncbi:NUDIX hydrolase domain-like protein [Xylogone sp. PMI_703]|nr:NUDIX hydrolase domain-like protein [Xylogone sp. PMI_703]
MSKIDSSKSVTPSFTSHPSNSPYTVSCQAYISNSDNINCKYIATGALVFDTSNPAVPRILLIQRSQSDSWPGCWEIPGGGCDDEDESILHAVARELWEEAGLRASNIGALVGKPHFFLSSSGKQICKFNFLVDVYRSIDGRLEVKLDPVEHQNFLWANEEEVRARRVGNSDLKFTTKESEDTILEGFRMKMTARSI